MFTSCVIFNQPLKLLHDVVKCVFTGFLTVRKVILQKLIVEVDALNWLASLILNAADVGRVWTSD